MTAKKDSGEVIAAAVVTYGGRVLLIRRAVTEGALSWQFPAGKVLPGEGVEEAAMREAAEETGVEVTAAKVRPDKPGKQGPRRAFRRRQLPGRARHRDRRVARPHRGTSGQLHPAAGPGRPGRRADRVWRRN
jgi:8-oxo-dGTP pyrophosphatase MutT (NUDIX family)